MHESRTANATLSSVLSRAAAAREELGYKDIMMVCCRMLKQGLGLHAQRR